MSPSLRGGTMLILNIKILRKVTHTSNLHTNIIYILYILSLAKPNETLRNLPKPPFPNFFATKPTQAQNELLRCCIFAS